MTDKGFHMHYLGEWVDYTKYFAWYIGDFRYPEVKIEALLFDFDVETLRFEMRSCPELGYELAMIVEDSDWLLFSQKGDIIEQLDKTKFYEKFKK